MKSKLPPGSRAERIEFVRNLRRQYALERPRVRLARNKRRIAVAGLFLVVAATGGGSPSWRLTSSPATTQLPWSISESRRRAFFSSCSSIPWAALQAQTQT